MPRSVGHRTVHVSTERSPTIRQPAAHPEKTQPAPTRTPKGFPPVKDVLESNPMEGFLHNMSHVVGPVVDGAVHLLHRIVNPDHLPWNKEGSQFLASTAELRSLLAVARDPASNGMAMQRALQDLRTRYGYTPKQTPQPGTLWIDPVLMEKELPQGKVTASRFPVGKPVSKTPAPMDVLFGSGKDLRLGQADGTIVDVNNADAYRALVAKNREQAGMPRKDGEPLGVHLALQGGGGMGKRYVSALSEMYAQGIVPVSVSGASVGAITASLVAAGADPEEIKRFANDPIINKFMDFALHKTQDAVMDGHVAYAAIDHELRKLTGIKDRPVTFADLKVPLQVVATRMADSAPPKGQELDDPQKRIFVFSQETTPNTPVALAVRASMALPGVFDPVRMVDPVTGRKVDLLDGGIMDNLPIRYNPDKTLPTVGLALVAPGQNHPADMSNTGEPRDRVLPGSLDTSNFLSNLAHSLELRAHSHRLAEDYQSRTSPPPGCFMVSLPVFNLEDPDQQNTLLGFKTHPKVDPPIDKQTHQVTQNFFREYMDVLRDPNARGSNCKAQLPAHLQFQCNVNTHGRTFQAVYSGGDEIVLTHGKDRHAVKLGKQEIEAMWLDGQAFGCLEAELKNRLDHKLFF